MADSHDENVTNDINGTVHGPVGQFGHVEGDVRFTTGAIDPEPLAQALIRAEQAKRAQEAEARAAAKARAARLHQRQEEKAGVAAYWILALFLWLLFIGMEASYDDWGTRVLTAVMAIAGTWKAVSKQAHFVRTRHR